MIIISHLTFACTQTFQLYKAMFVLQRAYTSAPGEGGVVSFKDYDRKFSSHAVSSHVLSFTCGRLITQICISLLPKQTRRYQMTYSIVVCIKLDF